MNRTEEIEALLRAAKYDEEPDQRAPGRELDLPTPIEADESTGPPPSFDSLPPPAEGAPAAGDVVQELLRREKARTHLIDLAQYLDDTYVPYPIHRLIASKLEDVEAGRLRRLALFVPPAIGKSRLASEFFPAWCYGRNPSLEFIETSYDYDLATGFGRNARNLMREPAYQVLFPEAVLSDDATAMDNWKTQAGGEYKAEGIGGGLIGFHAQIAVIDDPFKNYAEAASPRNQEAAWNWYTGVLLNRLRSYKGGPGAVILIMQRWHDNDLGGIIQALVEDGEEDWDIVCLPSLAEEHDLLGRAVGEPLLPDGPNQRSKSELEAIRARNPRMFMAVHQQKPIPDDGDIFKDGWLRPYDRQSLPSALNVYLTTDYAMTKSGGDFTVIVAAGVDADGHIWLLDLFREQCDILEGVEKTLTMMRDHKALKCFIERTAMSKAYGPLLMKRKREESIWTILEDVSIMRKGGKSSPDRAGALAGAMQMGYVHVPAKAPWRAALEYELLRFPAGKYDDQIDALALLGMRLTNLRGMRERSEPGSHIPAVKPVSWTFQGVMQAAERRRHGRGSGRIGGIVLPFPQESALDDDYGEQATLQAAIEVV